jgi:hypothetical protein
VPTPELNQGGSEPMGRGVLDTALRLKEKVVNFECEGKVISIFYNLEELNEALLLFIYLETSKK